MQLIPGPLNTTAHASVINPSELSAAVRCSRDRSIWEIDSAYRQIEPLKTDGASAFSFGSYQGVERFVLVSGDTTFATTTDLSADFLERTSDGDTTLMQDLAVESGYGIFQYQADLYTIAPTFIRRINIEDPTDTDLLRQNYDPSLYDDLTNFGPIDPGLTYVNYDAVGAGLVTSSEGVGTSATLTYATGGTLTFKDDYVSTTTDEFVIYSAKWTWLTPQSIPTGCDNGYAYLTLTRNDTSAIFANYSRDKAAEGFDEGFNALSLAGEKVQIKWFDGLSQFVADEARFILNGPILYIECRIPDTLSTFDAVAVAFQMTVNTPQNVTFGNIGYSPKPLIGSLEDNLEENGWLGGLGPVYTDSQYMDYAIRGSDATQTTFSPTARLFQVPYKDLWHYDYFDANSPAVPKQVEFNFNGYTWPDASGYIQVLRKASDGIWYSLGVVQNNQLGDLIDSYSDAELIAAGTPFTIDPEPANPSPQNMTAGDEWKAYMVLGDKFGRVYLSQRNDPSIFIYRDYVGGSDPLDPNRAAFLDVAGQNEPIVAIYGLDSLYVFTRRRSFYLNGPDGPSAVAAGAFLLHAKGLVGPNAACVAGNGIIAASDDALYALYVNPNNIGRTGDIRIENLTRDKLQGSYSWLIGDDDERARVSTIFAGDDLWIFRDERFMHRSRTGLWTTGEWADNAQVAESATDGLGRIALAFTDGRCGFLGPFPSDGGITPAGDDGLPIGWSFKTKQFMLRSNLDEIVYQRVEETTPTAMRIQVHGDNQSYDLDATQLSSMVANRKDRGGSGNVYWQIEVSGGAQDKLGIMGVTETPSTMNKALK